ncbi:Alpha-methyl-mannoside-specific lectin [Linum perenne]
MEARRTCIIIINTVMSSLCIQTCHTASLSLNYTNFDKCSSNSIKLFDSAVCANSGIQLTGFDYYITGQAQYSKPMRLWDSSTGKLTNFTTTFTFSMDNDNSSYACDGLAFFIASSNYSAPTVNASDGLLGLVDITHMYNSTQNPFVAVEFDTYQNPDWDTWSGFSHVGIDVNSIKSIASKRWRSYSNGTTMSAQISYKAGNLCVEFTGLTKEMVDVPRDTLRYEVDFKDYLTEWAVFGFSASTAFRDQSHIVKTWSFSSDLDSEGAPTMVKQGVNKNNTENTFEDSGRKKTNKSLTIGVVLGSIGALAIIIIVVSTIWVRSNKRPGPHLSLESGRKNPECFLRARAEHPSG